MLGSCFEIQMSWSDELLMIRAFVSQMQNTGFITAQVLVACQLLTR